MDKITTPRDLQSKPLYTKQITVYIGFRLSVTNRTISLTNVKKKNIYKNFSKNVLTCSRVNIRNIAELMSSIAVIVLQ